MEPRIASFSKSESKPWRRLMTYIVTKFAEKLSYFNFSETLAW